VEVFDCSCKVTALAAAPPKSSIATATVIPILAPSRHGLRQTSASPIGKNRISARTTTHVGSCERAGSALAAGGCHAAPAGEANGGAAATGFEAGTAISGSTVTKLLSATVSVHTEPSQYRYSCRRLGSGYQPALSIIAFPSGSHLTSLPTYSSSGEPSWAERSLKSSKTSKSPATVFDYSA
jgi:hypothetical protein